MTLVMFCAVEQTGKNTFFGRTATLLQSVENLGNLQKILMRVVIVLLVCFPTYPFQVIWHHTRAISTVQDHGDTVNMVVMRHAKYAIQIALCCAGPICYALPHCVDLPADGWRGLQACSGIHRCVAGRIHPYCY